MAFFFQRKNPSLIASLALTRLAQRKNIPIQSGVALSTAVRGVYFILAGPREDRSDYISVRHPSMLCAHAAPMGTTRSRWLRAALTALLFEHSQLSLKSGDPAITVEESRNVRPEYPKDEPSREHVQFVQRGLSYLPRYAIEHSENDNDADPVSRKCAH